MLTTENLILKPTTPLDLDIYLQILGSDELTKYLPKGSAYSKEEIEQYVTNRVLHWKHGFGSYVVYLKRQPMQKIGYTGVEYCQESQLSDIRYAILPDYQGKGYVFEAAQSVLAQTFKSQNFKKIYGVALKPNYASLAIIKKLGMTPDPTDELYGDVEDLETYSIENTNP